MKKIILFLCLFLALGVSNSMAQLYHSFGANISILSWNESQSSSNRSTLMQTSFTYFPRLNILERDNSSVSVGVPLSLGIGIASDVYGDAGVVFAFDIPVVLDYNFGLRSNMDNENNFGGYLGAGFGYNRVSISKSSYSDFNGSSFGPLFRGGVRIGSSNENWGDHGITVGIYYKIGLEKSKMTGFGFNVLYDL